MKDYKHIEHMRNLNDSLIWERMKRCYDYGYEDGQKEKPQVIYEMKVEEYNKGLNDAWEAAKKIIETVTKGGYRYDELSKIFGTLDFQLIFRLNTANEALAKIKAYEDKQKCKECKRTKDPIFYGHCVGECDYAKQTEDEIKVGDEVYSEEDDLRFVVTRIMDGRYEGICTDGACYCPLPLDIKKTGRHAYRIIKLLAELRGAE